MREKSLKSYVSTELFEVSQRKPSNLLDGKRNMIMNDDSYENEHNEDDDDKILVK